MQVVRPTPTAVYTGITHAVSRISSTEGALTMWRGMTSVVLGAGKFFHFFPSGGLIFQDLHMQSIFRHMKL
jgi:hypothetical protein